MAVNLPYMSSPGTLPKILEKIKSASVPENFNADFLATKLWFKWGNNRMFISWAKKCGFLNSDWTPTQYYKDFRNPTFSKETMARAIKIGYKEVYERNEFAESLDRKDFIKLITEITGLPHDNSIVKFIVSTFWYAKSLADFENNRGSLGSLEDDVEGSTEEASESSLWKQTRSSFKPKTTPHFWLSYTINLVLPKTDDPAVYNAIFRSLNENFFHE